MKVLIYDCEISRCIPSKGARCTGYEYCDGWSDFENMGVSVIGWGWLDDPSVNAALSVAEFQEVSISADAVAGFNSKSFDDNLMAANGLSISTDIDLLELVRLAGYGSSRWEDCPDGWSYGLDAIAQANGTAKTGSGALAPQWWQDGDRQKVIDYCKQDIAITRDMLRLGLAGKLVDPNTNEFLDISRWLPTQMKAPLMHLKGQSRWAS